MLTLSSVQASYGSSRVLLDVSLDIAVTQVVSLLGRNGMGKTTTVKVIMGLVPLQAGHVSFNSRSIGHQAPETIARLGIGLVPEGRQIFPTLNVRENLIATAANRLGRTPPWTVERVFSMFPRLKERAGQQARLLSGGEQQMLAIGRALLTNPQLLILDEATEGLAPLIRNEVWQCVAALKAEGMSILLIDKNIEMLKRISDHHVILEKGRTVWTGSSADLGREPGIVSQYLGVESAHQSSLSS